MLITNQSQIECFQNSRFGIFIHFGLYSIPAGVWKGKNQGRNDYAEWIKYQAYWPENRTINDNDYNALANELILNKFDAKKWAKEIKLSGAKYVIITTKHHDGFALFNSKVSDFNIVKQTPFKRDLLAELKSACDAEGIELGAYYSHWLDWHEEGGANPHWPELDGDPVVAQPSQEEFEEYFTNKCLPQLTELMDNYGIRIFWLDSWSKSPFLSEERIERILTLIHSRGGIVNSRVGTTWNHSKKDNANIDYLSMSDNTFPESTINRPWETSGTFNESWGYSKIDFKWKQTHELLLNLISNVSKNGNYQLNVGPLASGDFPAPSVRRMREMGAWLEVNGEAIYGATSANLPEQKWGKITKDNLGNLYLHLFEIDLNNSIIVKDLNIKPQEAYIIETSQNIACDLKDNNLLIHLPENIRNINIPVIKLIINKKI